MRLTAIVAVMCVLGMIVGCLPVQAQGISVNIEGKPLPAALEALSQQMGLKLTAQEGLAGVVTLKMEHTDLVAVLAEVCRQVGCKYEKTVDGYVLLKGKLPGAAGDYAYGENRVANGNFDAGLAGWVVLNGGGASELVESPVAGGGKAVKISGKIGEKLQGIQNWPTIPLVETRHYRFRMQYRTEGQPRLVVKLTARDMTGGTEHSAIAHNVAVGNSPEWATMETEFWVCQPVTEGTLSIHMLQSSGTAWIDDVRLEPVEFIGVQEQPAVDMTYNSGFENGVGDLPYGWCPANPNLWPLNTDTRQEFGDKVAFVWEEAGAHDGESCVSISNDGGPDEKVYLNWHRTVGLRADCDYEASVWMKTEGANKAYMVMSAFTPSGPASGNSTDVISGTTGWTQYRVVLRPKEVPDLEHGRLTVFLVLRGKGKVWFDDVTLVARPRK
ncbi:MAG: carbohydrate binding domain-containing protein [Armatimonadia bacterium]